MSRGRRERRGAGGSAWISTAAAPGSQSNSRQERRAAFRSGHQRCFYDAALRTATVSRRSMESHPLRPLVPAADSMSLSIPEVKVSRVDRLILVGLAAVGAIVALVGAASAPDRLWASVLLVGYYILGVGLA